MTTVEAGASATLWKSKNDATSISAQVNTSRHVSGPMTGHRSTNYGLGINHRF